MQFRLQVGAETANLAVPSKKLLGSFRGPSGRALEDIEAAVASALVEPLDAPPIRQAVVPGDRAVIVIDSDIPDPIAILSPLLACLTEADAGAATIILSPPATAEDAAQLSRRLPESSLQVDATAHNLDDESQHGYLAGAHDGRRIYLNRAVADADLLVAIGRSGYDPLLGRLGTTGGLYPALSNRAAWRRGQRIALESRSSLDSLRGRQGCDEVGWLAGLYYAINVALDRDNRIEKLWVGEARGVQLASDSYAEQNWILAEPHGPASLVIATVSNRQRPADWISVAAALENACHVVASNGTVVVLSDLASPLEATGRWLVNNDSPYSVLARLRGAAENDSLSTALLAGALSGAKVFLGSALDPQLVESIGVGVIANAAELARLVERHSTCFVLEDADRVCIPSKASGAATAAENALKQREP